MRNLTDLFLTAFRILMCMPIAVAWMLLYGLIWLSYGAVRGDMFIMAWNAFVANDTPVEKKEMCGCG